MASAPHLELIQPQTLPTCEVLSHDQILDTTFDIPRQLIAEVMIAQTANNWSGDVGIGKTWLELTAGRAIASGRDWLGRFPTERGPVLIIDQESHWFGIQARLNMLNRHEPLPRGTELYVTVPRVNLYINDPAGYAEIDRLLRIYQPALVCFDSFTRFHSASENDAGEMADVNASIRQLVQDHQCGVVLIDHSRKGSPLAKNDDFRHRLRGSIEKSAFVESAMLVERPDPDADSLTVRCTKARYAKEFDPFSVTMDIDGDRARIAYAGDAKAEVASKPSTVVAAIIELQANHGSDSATKDTIAGYLDISVSTVQRYIRTLSEGGLIRERSRNGSSGRGRPMKCYDVVRTD